MASEFNFHCEALLEYEAAAAFYLNEGSPGVATRFVDSVEAAIGSIVANPERWRVFQSPQIRRCVLQEFPFVIYYQLEVRTDRVLLYAIMHSSRKPGYWHRRVR